MELMDEILLYILRQENKRDEAHEARVIAALRRNTESFSYRMLEQIRNIIRDTHFDDDECFEKIEAIVCLFEEHGIDTGSRHDFG